MGKQEPFPESYLRLKEGTPFMQVVWYNYYQTINVQNHTPPGHIPGTIADGKIVTTVGLRHER